MKRTIVFGWGYAFSPFHAWAGDMTDWVRTEPTTALALCDHVYSRLV